MLDKCPKCGAGVDETCLDKNAEVGFVVFDCGSRIDIVLVTDTECTAN